MMLFQVTYTMLPGQRDAFLQMMRESGILDQIRREGGVWTTAITSRRRRTAPCCWWSGGPGRRHRRPTWPPNTWPGWAGSRPSMWRRPA